jgi:uncharacterized protein (TIGR02118 family)
MFVSNISLERRRADISLDEFRHHWLDPHGPMTSKLPGTRFYVQNHVLFTQGTNTLARKLGIDGFAQLAYDNLEARMAAYDSPELKACNLDSPLFLGGVSRVVTESEGLQPAKDEHLTKAMVVVPRLASSTGAPPSTADVLKHFPGAQKYTAHKIIEQAGPPQSKVPFIDLEIDLLLELWFKSEADLVACAGKKELTDNNIAVFHVKPYQLV